MRDRNKIILEYGTYMLAMFASYIASLAGFYYLSGGILMLEAGFLYVHFVKESKKLVELRGLFTLAWIGGQGLSCLKLSHLQVDWNYITWIAFFLAYVGFGMGYEWGERYKVHREREVRYNLSQGKRLLLSIVVLTGLSLLGFLIEATVLGFIPLFSDKPHAYSSFHLSGIHYFTMSCVLVPAMSILCQKLYGRFSRKQWGIIGLSNLVALCVPVLCVSRFHLLFAIGFAVVTYIMIYRGISMKVAGLLLLFFVPMYILLTFFRNHDVSYLNGIFEMKYAKMPIFITQPYIYITNNYDNFNQMVIQIKEHTHGLRMLFPLFALTGLKFKFPHLVQMPVFVTKAELTTLTMFYDAYYDFGLAGVFGLGFLIGVVSKRLMGIVTRNVNPISYLYYGQMGIYLTLSFFTTWFSNATTWFWFAMTTAIYWFVGRGKGEKER